MDRSSVFWGWCRRITMKKIVSPGSRAAAKEAASGSRLCRPGERVPTTLGSGERLVPRVQSKSEIWL